MAYQAVDCQGFAGGFTLGMVQAGFELVAKRERPGGFGVANCEANRHLLGHRWQTEVGPAESWSAPAVPVVFGNPPCSSFSSMTTPKNRFNAKIDQCMWDFVSYAARCQPTIAVFESVRQAYKHGRPFMQALRDHLEHATGRRYGLWHVYHNALDLGGAGRRPRYFWVASQVPFGVAWPSVQPPLVRDVIGDLAELPQTWEAQPLRRPASWWQHAHHVRRLDGCVDGHVESRNERAQRAVDLLQFVGDEGWPPGQAQGPVAKRQWETKLELPASWEDRRDALIKKDFYMGYAVEMIRWRDDECCRVVLGETMRSALHPTQHRLLTHREVARVMGFPDDWLIKPLRHVSQLYRTWGKGITVQCGRWLGGQVKAALDGAPGPVTGELVGDREWLIEAPPPRSKIKSIAATVDLI